MNRRLQRYLWLTSVLHHMLARARTHTHTHKTHTTHPLIHMRTSPERQQLSLPSFRPQFPQVREPITPACPMCKKQKARPSPCPRHPASDSPPTEVQRPAHLLPRRPPAQQSKPSSYGALVHNPECFPCCRLHTQPTSCTSLTRKSKPQNTAKSETLGIVLKGFQSSTFIFWG